LNLTLPSVLLLMLQSEAMLHSQCAENRIFIGVQEILEISFIIGNSGHAENIQVRELAAEIGS
jgi:hypothetical protein